MQHQESLSLTDAQGQTALMVAAQGGHMDILDLLIGLAEGKEALSTMLVAVDPEGEQVQ